MAAYGWLHTSWKAQKWAGGGGAQPTTTGNSRFMKNSCYVEQH